MLHSLWIINDKTPSRKPGLRTSGPEAFADSCKSRHQEEFLSRSLPAVASGSGRVITDAAACRVSPRGFEPGEPMGLNHPNLTGTYFQGGRTSSELSPYSCLQQGQANTLLGPLKGAVPLPGHCRRQKRTHPADRSPPTALCRQPVLPQTSVECWRDSVPPELPAEWHLAEQVA